MTKTARPDPDDAAAPARPPGRLRGFRRRILSYLLLYSIFVLLSIVGCTDRLILHPTTDSFQQAGTLRREVAIPAGGHVEVWTARSPAAAAREPAAFVLFFNGNADRAERAASYVAMEWTDRPVEVWAVNYPGYGGSPGPARLRSIPPAALAAYDALAAHAAGRPVIVSGQSLGTTAALHVAANRPVAGCVLWSPPPLRNLILGNFGWWNLWLLAGPVAMSIPSELDSVKNASKATAPATFVLTGRDSVVPIKYQMKVADAYAGEKRLVRLVESEHNAMLEGDSIREYDDALDWILEAAVRGK